MDTNPYEPPTTPLDTSTDARARTDLHNASPTLWTTLIGAFTGAGLCVFAAVAQIGPQSVLWEPGGRSTSSSVLVLVIVGSLIGLFLGLRMERGRQGKVE